MTTCRLARHLLWLRDRQLKNHDSIPGREGDLYLVQRVHTGSVIFITWYLWAPWALTPERKRQDLEPDHSQPSNAKVNMTGNLTYDITMRRFGLLVLPRKGNKKYIFWVYVSSLSCPACNAQAPCYISKCVLSDFTLFSTLSHKRHNF